MYAKTSAPGKLLLFGDHAVVYGYPCIVTAVNKRIYVKASLSKKNEDKIITPQVKESRFVLEAIQSFKENNNINKFVSISTIGDFSHRVGLGSSSAVTVATFGALNKLFNAKMSLKKIFKESYEVSLYVQGVGSGFDIAIATYGRTILYVKNGTTLKVISKKPLPLIVGYSGIKADTPYYIRKVEHMKKYNKEKFNTIFKKIGSVTMKAKKTLEKNDYKTLGLLMNQNHDLLKELGVSITKLDDMVRSAISAGAYGAKLSGAGGGDCMIALSPTGKEENIKKAIVSAGGEIIDITNSDEGLKIEK